MPIINLLPLSSKYILLACSAKIDLGLLKYFFPATIGTEVLSVEGARETLQEKLLLPASSMLTPWAPGWRAASPEPGF